MQCILRKTINLTWKYNIALASWERSVQEFISLLVNLKKMISFINEMSAKITGSEKTELGIPTSIVIVGLPSYLIQTYNIWRANGLPVVANLHV